MYTSPVRACVSLPHLKSENFRYEHVLIVGVGLVVLKIVLQKKCKTKCGDGGGGRKVSPNMAPNDTTTNNNDTHHPRTQPGIITHIQMHHIITDSVLSSTFVCLYQVHSQNDVGFI
jgi:hypothetical protein